VSSLAFRTYSFESRFWDSLLDFCLTGNNIIIFFLPTCLSSPFSYSVSHIDSNVLRNISASEEVTPTKLIDPRNVLIQYICNCLLLPYSFTPHVCLSLYRKRFELQFCFALLVLSGRRNWWRNCCYLILGAYIVASCSVYISGQKAGVSA
jgi:hypothetical protein